MYQGGVLLLVTTEGQAMVHWPEVGMTVCRSEVDQLVNNDVEWTGLKDACSKLGTWYMQGVFCKGVDKSSLEPLS